MVMTPTEIPADARADADRESAARLRAARAWAGLQAQEMARVLDISASTLNRKERGESPVTPGDIDRIVERCGVPRWFMSAGWAGGAAAGRVVVREAASEVRDLDERLSRLEEDVRAISTQRDHSCRTSRKDHDVSSEWRHDIFDRTEEERQRAFEHLARSGSSGANRDLIEVAVCADCGAWGRFDSDLFEGGCTDRYGAHLVTRVHIKAVSPAEADGPFDPDRPEAPR